MGKLLVRWNYYKKCLGRTNYVAYMDNITKEAVMEYSPLLADEFARNTAINTVEEIAEVVKGERGRYIEQLGK